MVCLVDDEEAYGECGVFVSPSNRLDTPGLALSSSHSLPSGYYMATLEASTQHLIELADQYSIQLAMQESKLFAFEETGGAATASDQSGTSVSPTFTR